MGGGYEPYSRSSTDQMVPIPRNASQSYLQPAAFSGSSGQVLVKACGRILQLEAQSARSITDMNKALQAHLQMEAETFELLDANGATLSTDAHILEAVAKGKTPLCASLTDTSLHFIENRREELGQMQWKLVRDQMAIMSQKLTATNNKLAETQTELEQLKQTSAQMIETVKTEATKAVESERDVADSQVRQLGERVNAVTQLLNSERQKRDTALQGLEKQIASTRNMVESERAARQQDFSMQTSNVQNIQAQLVDESAARNLLQDKHDFDIHSLLEKVAAFQSHVADMFQNHDTEAAKMAEGLYSKIEGQARQYDRLQVAVENTAQETNVRFTAIEERWLSMENLMERLSSRHSESMERIIERHERVSQVVEGLKLEEKQNKDQVQSALTRMKDLQQTLAESEGETRKLVAQERQGREDQMRVAQMSMQSLQMQTISQLEEKLSDRLERESLERERNVKTIVEEVGKSTFKGPLRQIASEKQLAPSSPQLLTRSLSKPEITKAKTLARTQASVSSNVSRASSLPRSEKIVTQALPTSSYSPPATRASLPAPKWHHDGSKWVMFS